MKGHYNNIYDVYRDVGMKTRRLMAAGDPGYALTPSAMDDGTHRADSLSVAPRIPTKAERVYALRDFLVLEVPGSHDSALPSFSPDADRSIFDTSSIDAFKDSPFKGDVSPDSAASDQSALTLISDWIGKGRDAAVSVWNKIPDSYKPYIKAAGAISAGLGGVALLKKALPTIMTTSAIRSLKGSSISNDSTLTDEDRSVLSVASRAINAANEDDAAVLPVPVAYIEASLERGEAGMKRRRNDAAMTSYLTGDPIPETEVPQSYQQAVYDLVEKRVPRVYQAPNGILIPDAAPYAFDDPILAGKGGKWLSKLGGIGKVVGKVAKVAGNFIPGLSAAGEIIEKASGVASKVGDRMKQATQDTESQYPETVDEAETMSRLAEPTNNVMSASRAVESAKLANAIVQSNPSYDASAPAVTVAANNLAKMSSSDNTIGWAPLSGDAGLEQLMHMFAWQTALDPVELGTIAWRQPAFLSRLFPRLTPVNGWPANVAEKIGDSLKAMFEGSVIQRGPEIITTRWFIDMRALFRTMHAISARSTVDSRGGVYVPGAPIASAWLRLSVSNYGREGSDVLPSMSSGDTLLLSVARNRFLFVICAAPIVASIVSRANNGYMSVLIGAAKYLMSSDDVVWNDLLSSVAALSPSDDLGMGVLDRWKSAETIHKDKVIDRYYMSATYTDQASAIATLDPIIIALAACVGALEDASLPAELSACLPILIELDKVTRQALTSENWLYSGNVTRSLNVPTAPGIAVVSQLVDVVSRNLIALGRADFIDAKFWSRAGALQGEPLLTTPAAGDPIMIGDADAAKSDAPAVVISPRPSQGVESDNAIQASDDGTTSSVNTPPDSAKDAAIAEALRTDDVVDKYMKDNPDQVGKMAKAISDSDGTASDIMRKLIAVGVPAMVVAILVPKLLGDSDDDDSRSVLGFWKTTLKNVTGNLSRYMTRLSDASKNILV